MATIRDVAREAKVGVGTVSRVLSDRGAVAPETRERVLATMRRLNYRPSPAARALAWRRSQTLEIVVPLFTRYLYVEVLRGIEAALAETDYALVIHTIERETDRDRIFTHLKERSRADGVIFVSLTPPEELVLQLTAAGIPIVLVDAMHPLCSSVTVDHARAARTATDYLLALGHRRIAAIDHRESAEGWTACDGRQAGYQAALAEAGIERQPEWERLAEFSPEGGSAACTDLLALTDPPTALFIGSDTQATGVLTAIRQHRLQIPGDLSVLGYNDIEMSWHIGLTTVRIPMRQMGQRGVELLLGLLTGRPDVPQQVSLPTELIIRGTCGPPSPHNGTQTEDSAHDPSQPIPF